VSNPNVDSRRLNEAHTLKLLPETKWKTVRRLWYRSTAYRVS
jgi:hypothetical protein